MIACFYTHSENVRFRNDRQNGGDLYDTPEENVPEPVPQSTSRNPMSSTGKWNNRTHGGNHSRIILDNPRVKELFFRAKSCYFRANNI